MAGWSAGDDLPDIARAKVDIYSFQVKDQI
jgi:hypothetical protein